ncbi:MAG: hypothetical protein R3346_00825 [Candidatus Spechtbacterales bacterium]|nr:hypothetical protein [Candidatus Spechtbacterales bacterium]
MSKKKVQINLSPSSSVLHISVSDELAGVLDQIVSDEADNIYLVVPEGAYIAQNVLNFQLLKRESESVGKNIVVVSKDPRIQKLAEKVSLEAQASIEENSKKQEPPARRPKPEPESKNLRPVADILPPERSGAAPPIADLRRFASEKSRKMEREEVKEVVTGEEAQEDLAQEELGKDFHVSEYTPKTKKSKKIKAPSINKKKIGSMLSAPFRVFKGRVVHVLIAIAVIAALGGGYYAAAEVLPKATITLHPKSVQDKMEFSLLADSNISSANLEKGTIPAQVIEEKQENTFTFNATGKADIEEYASGDIRVYNEYSSAPQTLVASTRFISADGKLFRTTETVVVPGAQVEAGRIIPSSINVNVEAAEPGDEYNIGPTTFSIPGFKGTDKYLNFYGKSESKMTGGFQGVATIVTEEDINDARNKIEEEFLPTVSAQLRAKAPESLTVLEESFESKIQNIEFDARANDRKTTFQSRAVAVAQAFLISEQDVNNAIERYFINSTKYSSDYELSDQRSIKYFVKEIEYEDGYVEFSVNVDQVFNRRLSTESVMESIKGKDETEVRKTLSRMSELEKAQVRFWPFWVNRVPSGEEDITIEVDYGHKLEQQ